VHHPNGDISILLVFSVKGVPDDIITGLGMKGGDTKDFVTSSLLGWISATITSISGWRITASPSTSSVTHLETNSELSELKIEIRFVVDF